MLILKLMLLNIVIYIKLCNIYVTFHWSFFISVNYLISCILSPVLLKNNRHQYFFFFIVNHNTKI